jgi:hypothetical protein
VTPLRAVAASAVLAGVAVAAGGGGDISVTPLSLTLGPVLADSLAQGTLSVKNLGAGALTFGEITVGDPAFDAGSQVPSIPPGFTLGAGATVNLDISFRSASVGTTVATLTIPTDDPDEAEVAVALRGIVVPPPVIQVTPDSLSESLSPGQTRTRQLTIANSGASALSWSVSIVPVAGRSPLRGSLDGVNVLWDRSHGQINTTTWTAMVDSMEARGATVTEVTGSPGTITAALLGSYRLYWSVDVGSGWTAAERGVLATWVSNGGGIILLGDNLGSLGHYDALLASLGSSIRMSSVLATSGTTTSAVLPHAVTQGVGSVYIGVNARTLSVPQPAQALVNDATAKSVAAAEEVGIGRVLVFADEVLEDPALATAALLGAQNLLLGQQSVDWLAGAAWLTAPIRTGTVAAGGSQLVDLVFDPAGLAAGAFDLNVRVGSNDPLNPVLDVPVHLVLTGAPDISLSAASYDFGAVPVGGQGGRTLDVRNLGQDTLSVSSILSSTPYFSAGLSSFILAPAESASVPLTFRPDSVGSFQAGLTITSDDPDEPSVVVALAGQGRVDCTAPCAAPSLRPADAQGSFGFDFVVDVNIAANPAPITSFGFQLSYDGTLIEFADSAEAGQVAPGFLVSAQENQPGLVTCGGFGVTGVPASSAGSIARLHFRVLCDTCTIGTETDLILSGLTDDVALLNACCGTFTLTQCPSGTGDVNTDGALTPQDALCALKIFLNGGILPADPQCDGNGNCEVENADADCDGTVTPGDALSIHNAWLAGSSPSTCVGLGGAPRAARALRFGDPVPGSAGTWELPILAAGAVPESFGLDLVFDPAEEEWVGVRGVGWRELSGVGGRGRLRVGGFAPDGGERRGEAARIVFRGTGAGGRPIRLAEAFDVAFEGAREVFAASPSAREGLLAVGPVPAGSRVDILYGVPAGGVPVELRVLDVAGRVLRTVDSGPRRAGQHRVSWDGRDDAGKVVAAGIYFVRLEAGERTWTRRAVLVR